MNRQIPVDELIAVSRGLSSSDKRKLFEQLAADISAARRQQDEEYQRGYEQIPEAIDEVEAILPHLPLGTE